MIKGSGKPPGGRMAVIAIIAAGEVGRIFTSRYRAIVTGTAGTDDLGVIDEGSRLPQRSVVAVFANISGLDMRQALTGRFHAIVTASATAGDARMVKNGGSPGRGLMAVITLLAAGEMGGIFSRCNNTVVAGPTTSSDCSMVHIADRAPGRRGVAV